MSDDAALLLRVSAFGLVAGAIYWFLSYEALGTVALPLASIWPFAASFGLAVVGSGLIFRLWLVILGLGIALYSGWGWIAAIVRENRYGHIQPTDQGQAEEPEEAGRRR